MMKLIVASLVFLVLCAHVHHSRAKLRAQHTLDEEEDSDDWEDDEDDDDEYRKTEIDDDGRIYKNPRNSPSVMCPRDEEQAERLGQKCLRKCSTDEDCKSKKKKCHCDGACGMSCIKPDRECAELEDLENGGMTVTGKLFGDVARYTCDPNMYAVGLTERSCRADGHWTGTMPKCKKDPNSFCLEPPKITNARHNALIEQTTFDLDSTVRYFCFDGYETEGFPTAKCLMKNRAPASWFGPDILCKPKDCGLPPAISNGRHAGTCHTYDCRISYHCADGYELVGRDEKVCLSDGTWAPSELPQCVQVKSVQCPPPENPRHGTAIYTSCSYNSIVSYECKYGYMIEGSPTRRCGADKRWTGQTPICKEINCGSPGTLYNGWIENIESGTGLGASIIFRCNPRMKLEGNTSSVCQIDGRWRYPLPSCLAPCVVPRIEHGHVTTPGHENVQINNVSMADHGEKLIVLCEQNYEYANIRMPVYCKNGTWSTIPKCTPARCKQMPKPPRNGMVIAPKTEHGMRAVFRCKDGFELKGDSLFVECRYGNWTGEIPQCHEVFCPFPGYITNGKVLLVGNMGVYEFRPYVKKIVNNKQIMYDCDRGYVLSHGPPGATCIGGYWSPRELPKCIPGQHPRLRWSRRRRSTGRSPRVSSSSLPYQRVIRFFRRTSRKTLHSTDSGKMYGHKGKSSTRKYESNLRGNHSRVDAWKSKLLSRESQKQLNRTKMVEFLRVIYQKLVHLDEKHSHRTGKNLSMHELLNLFSTNVFGANLEKNVTIASSPNETVAISPMNRNEFKKYRNTFEKYFRAYSKMLKRGEKKEHANVQRMWRNQRSKRKKKMLTERQGQTRETGDEFAACQNLINIHLRKKIEEVQTNDTTCRMSRGTGGYLCTAANGTAPMINDICARFSHIIENILYSDIRNSSTSTSTFNPAEITVNSSDTRETTPLVAVTSASTRVTDVDPEDSKISLENVKLSVTGEAGVEGSVSYRSRKLFSVDYPLTNEEMVPNSMRNSRHDSRRSKANQPRWSGFQARRNYSNRGFSPARFRTQTILKNSYLMAYEDGYRANVKRFMSPSNRTRRYPHHLNSARKSDADHKFN